MQHSLTTKIKNAKRLSTIIHVFAKNGFFGVLEKSGLIRLLSKENQQKFQSFSDRDWDDSRWAEGFDHISPENEEISVLAFKLRRALEELGPVFVKLGQLLASREDLLPRSVVSELRKLHHAVTPLSFGTIEKILKEELSSDTLSRIDMIEKKPLAAGSIGQVHAAKLVSGEMVVIKVRRPEVENLIKRDLSLIKLMGSRLEKYFKNSFKIDIVDIIEQFGSGLESEVNFLKEASNTMRIKDNFHGWNDIVVPEVFWDFSTKRVLVLELIEGVQLNDKNLEGPENSAHQIESICLKAFMKMVLIDGDYHGDLHPGNLILVSRSRVGIIDFGLTYRLLDSQRMALSSLFGSLLENDFPRVSRRLSEIGRPGDGFDLEKFQLGLLNDLTPYSNPRLKDANASGLIYTLIQTCVKNDLSLPPYLVIVFKTLVGFEKVAGRYEKRFNIFEECRELTEEIKADFYSYYSYKNQLSSILEESAHLAKAGPYQVSKVLRSLAEGNQKFVMESEGFERLAKQIGKAASIVSVSLVMSAVLIGSSLLLSSKGGGATLGSAGFVLATVLGLYIAWKVTRQKY